MMWGIMIAMLMIFEMLALVALEARKKDEWLAKLDAKRNAYRYKVKKTA